MIVKRFRSDCAVIVEQLPYDFASNVKRSPTSNFIVLWLESDLKTTAKGLRTYGTAFTERFQNECKVFAQRFGVVQRLRSYRNAVGKSLRSSCTAIAQRFKGVALRL